MGFALAALLAGAVGCTGGSGDAGKTSDSASAGTKGAQPAVAAKACANGTYTWTNIEKPTRLLGVSDAETLVKAGGTLKNKVRRLASVRIAVQAGTGAPAAKAVLTSLGRTIGEIDSDGDVVGFTDVDREAPELNEGSVAPQAAGRFVQYAAVRAVEADFRYTCSGGRTTIGHAESWTVSIDGILECSQSTGSAAAREAARISCGADSVAAKTA